MAERWTVSNSRGCFLQWTIREGSVSRGVPFSGCRYEKELGFHDLWYKKTHLANSGHGQEPNKMNDKFI